MSQESENTKEKITFNSLPNESGEILPQGDSPDLEGEEKTKELTEEIPAIDKPEDATIIESSSSTPLEISAELATPENVSNPEINLSPKALEITSKTSENAGEIDTNYLEYREIIADLENQKQTLNQEIASLRKTKNKILKEQLAIQENFTKTIQDSLSDLQQRKQALEVSVEQLERRRDRIQEEMRTTFAGVSQELAIRVQGFKEYLVGSLQDLAAAAEDLELSNLEPWEEQPLKPLQLEQNSSINPQFSQGTFANQTKQIKQILDQYRTRPDYYGPSWQLRRTFEPIHAERVNNWFFSSGGRGAIKTMGSRLQNILITSAVISVLHNLYSDRVKTLILAHTPERLGEWRRGLQDCLGISRSDFGPERGIVLFETTDAIAQKAERLVESDDLPLIIIDETEERIDLALLQFPLWLAFAPEPQPVSNYIY